jgi:hypothetical protein
MKFTHKLTPTAPLKRFDLRVPMPDKKKFGLFSVRNVRVLDGENQLFQLQVLSIKNKIKFNVPSGVELAIGKQYTLEIETTS